MRLIDADEIKKRERDVVLANGAKHRCFDTTLLVEIPTIDAVDVVRCKDCKWCEERQGRTGNVYNHCVYLNTWVDEDHFCSCGERREDG